MNDPSLVPDYSWKVHDDLCGSDHFPIILEHLNPSITATSARYKFNKANWAKFEALCLEELCSEIFKENLILLKNLMIFFYP